MKISGVWEKLVVEMIEISDRNDTNSGGNDSNSSKNDSNSGRSW